MSAHIEALRTPDERFQDLPGYAYRPHYIDDLAGFEGLRLHFVDERPVKAQGLQTFLCLHGEPSWAYLYRKMIPHFLAGGGRVVAPDFFWLWPFGQAGGRGCLYISLPPHHVMPVHRTA